MHTNGGDRWLAFDRRNDKTVADYRSQVKTREMVALLNTAADWFCDKPRYEMRRWDEQTATVQKMDETPAEEQNDQN